jgi:hypothetical protein
MIFSHFSGKAFIEDPQCEIIFSPFLHINAMQVQSKENNERVKFNLKIREWLGANERE